MLRSGQFDNLQWDKLAEAHTTNWGLVADQVRPISATNSTDRPLSDLAVQSVRDCRKYLFTDGSKCRTGRQTGGLVGILSAEGLEECLTPALCDHLLVTFAYRFFCDNLAPRTLSDCLNAIYSCLSDSLRVEYKYGKKEKDKATGEEKTILVEDKDGTRILKSNFMKPKERSCRAYNEKLTLSFPITSSSYKTFSTVCPQINLQESEGLTIMRSSGFRRQLTLRHR